MKWTKTRIKKYLKGNNSKILICHDLASSRKLLKKYPKTEGYRLLTYIFAHDRYTTKSPTLLTTEIWETLSDYEQTRVVHRLPYEMGYFRTAYEARLIKFRRETSDLVSKDVN